MVALKKSKKLLIPQIPFDFIGFRFRDSVHFPRSRKPDGPTLVAGQRHYGLDIKAAPIINSC